MTQLPPMEMGDREIHNTNMVKPGRPLTWYVLIILACEKIVQHTAVTLAIYHDWNGIRSRLAVNPDVLMVLGAIVAVLFVLSLVGLLRYRSWSSGLLIGLALFDIVGEFIAQGTVAIVITVSFLVALVILILAIIYQSKNRHVTG
jgi:uncharacterized membrane protein